MSNSVENVTPENVTTPPAPKAEKPSYDWLNAPEEEISRVFSILLPGFEISEFNPAGLKKRIAKKARGRSPQDIVASHTEKIQKKKSSIPEEVIKLEIEQVQDLLYRLNSRVVVAEKYPGDKAWQAYRLLAGKLSKRKLSVAESWNLPVITPGERRARFSVIPTDVMNVDKPMGYPKEVSELFQKFAQADKNAEFGRAISARPLAMAKVPEVLGNYIITIPLGKEYAIPDATLAIHKKRTEIAKTEAAQGNVGEVVEGVVTQ